MSLLPPLLPMQLDTLQKIEGEVTRLLDGQPSKQLRVLGYGEITVAVAYPALDSLWACKRMPPFADHSAAQHYARQVQVYQEKLTAAGVAVVPTQQQIVMSRERQSVLYLIQSTFPSEQMAVQLWRGREPSSGDPILQSILAQILTATSPQLALDAQLANWVWDGERAWQFDISTPFMRTAAGHDVLDRHIVAQPYPAILRPLLSRWVVPGVLAKYHSRRGVMADFAGNLIKEGLGHWLPAVLQAFNLHLDQPLELSEVQTLYAKDARLWEWMYRLKRFARSWSRGVHRLPYPYLLSPPVQRHQEKLRA